MNNNKIQNMKHKTM